LKDSLLCYVLCCEVSLVEIALSILRATIVQFPGNAVEISVWLLFLILDVQKPELITVIWEILAKQLTNPSAFYSHDIARDPSLVKTYCLDNLPLFKDLIS
jgi:hypothetical protein